LSGLVELLARGAAPQVRAHVAEWLSLHPATRRAELSALRVAIARAQLVDPEQLRPLATRLDGATARLVALERELDGMLAELEALTQRAQALTERTERATSASRKAMQHATSAASTAESVATPS
jgi:DNA repair ATPase RecN